MLTHASLCMGTSPTLDCMCLCDPMIALMPQCVDPHCDASFVLLLLLHKMTPSYTALKNSAAVN